jgi:hypothetical protein
MIQYAVISAIALAGDYWMPAGACIGLAKDETRWRV